MHQDLWKYGLSLTLAGALGWIAGYPMWAICIASIFCYLWQTYQLNELYQWVRKNISEPATAGNGLSYHLHRELSRNNKKNSEREKLLKTTLSQFRKAATVIPASIVLIDDHGQIEWANQKSDALLNIQWPRDRGVRIGDLLRDPDLAKLLDPASTQEAGIEVLLPANRHQTINFKCVRYTEQQRMVIARDVSRLLKINKMHTDFIANVSHELKTPLTVLKGYVEIIQAMEELPEKLGPPIDQMGIQTHRMELIVKDLIYLAKLEELTEQHDHQKINVSNIVNSIIDSIQPIILSKRHKIELDIDPSINILGNQNELHSAFLNLVSNAINYTDKNGLIRLKWEHLNDQGVFSVKDNGMGIPASDINNLTTRFYRVDDDRSRDSGGTGLGLAIVKHVLQRHNASIEIRSEVDVGSEFACVFPPSQLRIEGNKRNTEPFEIS